MKFISIIMVIGALSLAGFQPLSQYWTLRQAEDLIASGEYQRARPLISSLLEATPAHYHKQAQVICGTLAVAESKAMTDGQTPPDYAAGARVLRGQSTTCHDYTDPETEERLLSIGERHLMHATDLCTARTFRKSHRQFQAIIAIGYPHDIHKASFEESGHCWIAQARADGAKSHWDLAFTALSKAQASGSERVRREALDAVELMLPQELSFWMDRAQYVKALEMLTVRRNAFAAPEIKNTLWVTSEKQFEQRTFGFVLARGCRGTAQEGLRTLEIKPEEAPSKSKKSIKNVTVKNATKKALSVVMAGPEKTEFTLKAKGRTQISLTAGEYVAGFYAPRECGVKAKKAKWTVNPYTDHTFEIVMGDA